jgi:hypothetical protein
VREWAAEEEKREGERERESRGYACMEEHDFLRHGEAWVVVIEENRTVCGEVEHGKFESPRKKDPICVKQLQHAAFVYGLASQASHYQKKLESVASPSIPPSHNAMAMVAHRSPFPLTVLHGLSE